MNTLSAFGVLLTSAIFVITCIVGCFAGLFSFIFHIQLERNRIGSQGPWWHIGRTWSYPPEILTEAGKRVLPRWRKALHIFFACLVIAPISGSAAYWLVGKESPLFAQAMAPNISVQRTAVTGAR